MKLFFKSIIVMMLGFCMPILRAQNSQNESRMQGFEVPLRVGSTINFTYNPNGGPLEGETQIEGVAYLFNNYKWELADVELVKGSNIWNGTFTIPDNCAFVAFKFLANTENGVVADTNIDNGFIYAPLTKENAKNPGNDLAWGTFRSSNFNQQFNGYFKEFSIMEEASEYWMKQEIKDNPEKLPLFIDTYLKVAEVRLKDRFEAFGNNILKQFLSEYPNLTEAQLITVKDLYAFKLNNKAVADSLQAEILQTYPKGILSRNIAFRNINEQATNEIKLNQILEFLNAYPSDASVPKSQAYIYNKVYQNLFGIYFENEAFDKATALLPHMNFSSIIDSYHHHVSKAFHFKTVNVETLLALSTKMITEMESKINDLSYAFGLYWSPNQATKNARNQFDKKLNTHIKLLIANNEHKRALAFFEKYSSDASYSNSAMNEIHFNTLKTLNKPTKALLEQSAAKNALTPVLLDALKANYISENKNERGFATYLEKLKAVESSALEEKVKSHLTNIEAPVLLFEDQAGKQVKLKGKKDEIIVIDFWATWCAPCKKAFPGMQMAVNKFKTDKKVNFYFVSVQETTADYVEKATSYMTNKGYDFNLLFDTIPEDGNTNNKTFRAFSTLFKSSGIPRKVIIKNGKLRYTSEGYSGSPSELFDELNMAIKILKSEDK